MVLLECHLRLSDAVVDSCSGRAFGIASRQHNPDGFLDLSIDDYPEGSLYLDWQNTVLDTARVLAVSI